MPTNIRCLNCGFVVLGFESASLRPVDGDECPECGGDSFEVAD
ncbi:MULTISPECIES: hypothetical protein [Halostella]|nr:MULTISPECIES: hypothetical protein [Halostella]